MDSADIGPADSRPAVVDAGAGRRLAWGLTLATYNRRDVLLKAVRCALLQSRLPSEIVIVDSSDDWAVSRDAVRRVCDDLGFAGPFVYEQARIRGQPAQRNQAIESARADVLFMIDDDSLMFRQCAEQVMKVYEGDPSQQVIGVAPGESSVTPLRDDGSILDQGIPVRTRLRRKLNDAVKRLMLSPTLEPYFIKPVVSEDLRHLHTRLGVKATMFLPGYLMTLRRTAAQSIEFDSLMTYAALEDADALVRLRRLGSIVSMSSPLMFHMVAARTGLHTRASGATTATFNLNFVYVMLKNFGYSPQTIQTIRSDLRKYQLLYWLYGISQLSLDRWRGGKTGIEIGEWLIEQAASKDLKEVYPQATAKLKERLGKPS